MTFPHRTPAPGPYHAGLRIGRGGSPRLPACPRGAPVSAAGTSPYGVPDASPERRHPVSRYWRTKRVNRARDSPVTFAK